MSEDRFTSHESAAVRAEYERLAQDYERRWGRYTRQTVRATIRRLPPCPAGGRVLDVGCGTGAFLRSLADRDPTLSLTGIDLSPAMIQAAVARGTRARLLVANAMSLPLASGSFDGVVSTSALHYWPDPAAGLAELRRVLRPGGWLVITDWCGDYLSCRVCEWALRTAGRAIYRTFTTAECERLLTAAGFHQVAVTRYRVSWLWGMMTGTAEAPVGADSPVTPA